MRHADRQSSYPTRARTGLRLGASLTVLAAALAALAACNKPAQGLVTVAPPPGALTPIAMSAPLVDAPTVQALPAAPRARVARVATRPQGYAFADRAYAMSDAFADAPPDYAYDYGGVRPWVWRAYDGAECIAEAVPGGERIYYYEPGADSPFFIEDPGYGYGFEDGALVSVYDSYGDELPYAYAEDQSEWAGRYLARAYALYGASRQAQRYAVAEQNWQARRGYLDAQRQAWGQQLTQNADWQAYHQQYYPAVQAHYAPERRQRLAWAARVDQLNHNPARAQQEFAAAQGAHQALAAQRAGQQAFPRQQQAFAQQQAEARQRMFAQQRAMGRQQGFAQQQAIARQQAFAQRQAMSRQQAFAAQRQSRFAQQRAQQQAMARQAAVAQQQRRGQLFAQQQRAQRAAMARQQAMTRQAASVRAEAGRRAQLMAERQQAGRAAMAQRQAAAQQGRAEMAERQAAAQQARFAAQRADQQQAALRAEGQRRAQMAAQQQVAARAAAQQRQAVVQAQAQAARAAQQRSAQAAAAHAQAAAAQARRQPKKG